MRFLHLGDLHLGKKLNDVDLLEDQKYALEQALEQADKVDCVLISGDVYDKADPKAEAMTLFDGFITSLVAKNKKIFIISGNHDSDQRISYFSKLLKENNVFFTSKFEGVLQTYELEDEYGKLYIHLLPFLKPIHVKRIYPEESIKSYEDAIKVVLEKSNVDTSKRNIILVHQFITGSERSDSEEYTVGGLDNIDYSVFDNFDYVALGHIHKPQHIVRETLRYSGSLLKYSFSEEKQNKSFCLVDVKEKGNIEITKEPIKFLHDVVTKEGLLEDILKQDYSEDYIRVILHDEDILPDTRIKLLTIFPNMMKFSVENSKTKYEKDVISGEEFENKSIKELFIDFYKFKNNNQEPDEARLQLFDEVLKKMEDRQ